MTSYLSRALSGRSIGLRHELDDACVFVRGWVSEAELEILSVHAGEDDEAPLFGRELTEAEVAAIEDALRRADADEPDDGMEDRWAVGGDW